jgi:hypothetical protein
MEHNSWTPGDKAACVINALNEPATHGQESVPTGSKHEEVIVVLENQYGDHHLAEAFHAQLRRRSQHVRESLHS